METGEREVRLEHLHPHEIDAALRECPVLFQPLGTIEWHGRHNLVGLDALKAHELCVRAARRGGGRVAPALYGGVGGLAEPHTFIMDAEDSIYSLYLRPWVERLCAEAVRQGWRAIIILTGHYGAAQQMVVRELAVRMTRATGRPVLGTPEYILALDVGYLGDHAAWGETALMMELYPESIDLAQLGEPPYQGVGGRDPKEATRADGARLVETIVGRLATLASRMSAWDAVTIERFARAESAIVTRQMTLAAQAAAAGQPHAVWNGWRNIGQGALREYGRLLAEERFEEIAKLAEQL